MIRVVAAWLSLFGTAGAQEALYGAQPPAGSAYVRFVNATALPVEVDAAGLPGQALDVTDEHRVTPYLVAEHVAGRTVAVTIRSAGRSASTAVSLAADGFATVLLRAAADGTVYATVAPDGGDFNQARARLSFYNATPSCGGGSLSLAAAGTAVFTGVAAGGGKSRTVNPVAAGIRAACVEGAAPDMTLSGMEVGSSYSVWLMQPGEHPASFISRDTTMPYKK